MDNNNKVCRICLGCSPQEYYSLNHGTPSYQFKIQECIPFMNFKIILDPIICTTCAVMVDRSYQLLIVARNVEVRLDQYMKECSSNEACYIMAHKPAADLLEGLTYRTVVDESFNFRMVVAMVVKAEPLEKNMEETAVKMIKMEAIEQDYKDTEMPNLDMMAALPPAPELVCAETTTSRINSLPDINHSLRLATHFLSPITNTIPAVPQTPDQRKNPCKIVAIPYSIKTTRLQRQIRPSSTSTPNEGAVVSGTKSRSRTFRECPICHKLYGNLKSHMRIHLKQLSPTDSTSKGNTQGGATVTITYSKCFQCGFEYSISDGHQCLFSCHVRLQRSRSLEARISKEISCHVLAAHNSYSVGRPFDDEAVSDSSTLSGLSIYNEEREREPPAAALAPLFRCGSCLLRFDNGLQLRRHLSLNHSIAGGVGETPNDNNGGCSVVSALQSNARDVSVLDEHSYAWLKSIQCWNCSQSFSTREEWLLHDYRQHEALFPICYICFRAFGHTQVVSHLAHAHSLPLAADTLPRMLGARPRAPAPSDWRSRGVRVDDTYSRMSRFIMFAYQLTHCPLCQKPCGNTSVLMRHLVLNRCTESRCLLCRTELYSSLHLLDHIMTYGHKRQVVRANSKVGEKYLSCLVCDSVFALDAAFVRHSCCDRSQDALVVYKRKMGLWTCSECLIMSPFGITAKLQHILSPVHLKCRLKRLVHSADLKNDLTCHLCPDAEPYTSKLNLIDHLKSVHIESVSVLCPLCHCLLLNTHTFTKHINNVHREYLLPQGDDNCGITRTLTSKYCEELTCLLCHRNHSSLQSFAETCGQGHPCRTFTLDNVVKYLDLFEEEKWLHFNGALYNCECGRVIQTSRDLYKHYRGILNYGHKARCTFWISCVECGVLISPGNKLAEHREREHRGIADDPCSLRLQDIKCADQTELLDVKSTESTKNEESTPPASLDEGGVNKTTVPLLGKRKRRKTQVYREIEESGGLLAMDKKLRIEIEAYNKKAPRGKSYSSTNLFTSINLTEVEKINSPSMQPVVQLKELLTESTTAIDANVETAEGPAAFSANNEIIELDDDGDDRSSSSDFVTLVDQEDIKEDYQAELSLSQRLEIPIPFIDPKNEELNIALNMDYPNITIDRNQETACFPKEILLDDPPKNENDVEFIETLLREQETADTINGHESQSRGDDDYVDTDPMQLDLCSPVTNKVNSSEKLTMVKNTLALCSLTQASEATVLPLNGINDVETTAPVVNETPMKIVYKCDNCHLLGASQRELSAHSCRLSKIDVVQCAYCHKDFLNAAKLRFHVMREHSSAGYLSGRARVNATRQAPPRADPLQLAPNALDGHVVSVMSRAVQERHRAPLQLHIRCSLCRDVCDDMEMLIAHMKANHFQSICIHCDDRFANSESLDRHVENCVHASRNLELNRIIFGRSFESSGEYSMQTSAVDHLVDASAIQCNIFRCLDCDLLLPGLFVVKEHFTCLHAGVAGRVYSCHMCDAFAVNEALMRQHRTFHKDGGLKCIACGRMFTSFVDFKIHYGEHKLASCPFCPRMFLHLSDLRVHQNSCLYGDILKN